MTVRPPYPGLRPFRRDETDLFFGREGNVDEIIDRLAATRFVAVLGASGSGKSSLVKTGLLEALELGQLHQAGTAWRVADFRPGDNPVANLARALLRHPEAAEDAALEIDMLAAFLRRGPRAVVEWCADGHLAANTNLLLLVDQFEELFRYDSYATREQAQAFVNLLIESAQQRDLPIFVVLTMRSEYLGACSLIDGLAEAINRGQYLTTRMTREQCRRAIVGPAKVCEIEIEPALVNRLLNDLAAFAPWDEDTAGHGDAPQSVEGRSGTSQLDRLARRADQLPLMSHVLNRLWSQSRERGDVPPQLALADYAPVGLRGALSAHAEDVLKNLVTRHGDRIVAIAEKVFRALVSGASVADAVRRPTAVAELVTLAGDDRDAVLAVVEAFRATDCSFLLPESSSALTDRTQIDISHESLIRQWDRLSGWVETEGAAGTWWRRLVDDAMAWKRLVDAKAPNADESLLRGVELTQALDLRAAYRPTPAWSGRYGGNFETAERFLERSAEAQSDSEHEHKRRRWIRYGAIAMAILAVGAGIWAKVKDNEAAEAATQSGERAFGAVVTRAIGSQEQGDWQTAGALLGSLVDGILVDRKGEPALPPLPSVQVDKLDWALRRQFANLWAARIEERNGGRRATDFYGSVKRNIAAIAVRYDDRIETHWAQPNGQWFAGVTVRDVKLAPKQDRFPMAFYDYAGGLAVLEGDELVLHPIGPAETRTARRLKIVTDDGAKETTGNPDQTSDTSRVGAQRATVFTRMVACDATRTAFIAWDDAHAVWQINVANDRAASRRLLSGEPTQNWTVEPDGNRYALTLSKDTPRKVYVGECDRPGDPQLVPMAPEADIRDIEFTNRNLLAVVDRSKETRFFEPDAEGRWQQKSEAVRYPAEATYVAFADDRRLWLSYPRYYNANGLRYAGTELKLWNAATKAVEGSIVPTTTRSDPPWIVGRTQWVLWNDKGKPLTVQRPVPASLSVGRFSAMSSAVGSGSLDLYDDDDDSSGKYIRDAWKHFGDDGSDGRSNAPMPRELPSCGIVFEQIANAWELRSADADAASSGARQLAVSQIVPTDLLACTEGAEVGEKALIAKLANSRTELLDAIETLSNNTEKLTDSYRGQLASMAVRGSPGALRMLATDFHMRGEKAAAQALDRQIVVLGLAPSYRFVEAVARNPALDAALIEMIAGRKDPTDGRDREVQARLAGRNNKSEALLQLALAQRHYERMGDSFSAKRITAARNDLAREFSDDDLLSLWRSLAAKRSSLPSAAPVARPKLASPPAGVATLPESLEMLAAQIGDLEGRAEILMSSIRTSQPNDQAGVARRLRQAWLAADPTPDARKSPLPTGLACEIAEAAEKNGMLPEMQRAAGDCVAGRSATLDAGDDTKAPAMVESLERAMRAKVANTPNLLAQMNWDFTHLRWGGFNNNNVSKQRQLLVAARDLQEALVAGGADRSADLMFAMADTYYWLGRFNASKPADQQKFYDRAQQLFEELDKDKKGPLPLEVRLQWIETLVAKANSLVADTSSNDRKRIAAYENAKNRLEELAQTLGQRPDGDYLRVATASNSSIAYGELAYYLARTALAAWADGAVLEAERDARASLRYGYRQAALFAPDGYGRIGDAASLNSRGLSGEKTNKEVFCCLEPNSDGTETWVIGMLAGQQTANQKGGPAPTRCEQLASSPMDPVRRVRGVLNISAGKDADSCMDELERYGRTGTEDYLLARLYKASNVPKDDVIRMLVSAANAGHAIAYFDLSIELRDCKRIAPALLDRYRYRVMHDYLAAARPRLFPTSRNADEAAEDKRIAEWLESMGKAEPESTGILPKPGERLDLTFLMQQCAK